MYKVIFIDIDGTLRNSKRELTNRTISAIKKVIQKGILVVLCSGRPQKFTEDVSRECGASQNVVMGNAIEEVKKYADEITLTNNQDGVAIFLEKLI